MKSGILAYICVGAKRGVAKRPVDQAALAAGEGIEGDVHAGPWHRQVSLLDVAAVEAMRARLAANEPAASGDRKGRKVKVASRAKLGPGAFGENLGVQGLDLTQLGLGSRLNVGESAQLIISQIGKKCHTPCAIFAAAGECIMPRVGLFARVALGGDVRPGDTIGVVKAIDRSLFQAVVLTISDRCSRGEAEDTAGPAAANLLRETGRVHLYRTNVLPDEEKVIKTALCHYSDGRGIDLVLTVGGTGFSPRDVTPEATRAVIERPAPGLDEVMRAASLAKTPHAMLSRGVSGIRGSTLIVNLPGSQRAAAENLTAILPALPHALEKLRGDPEPCG